MVELQYKRGDFFGFNIELLTFYKNTTNYSFLTSC